LDEISIATPTRVAELRKGEVRVFMVTPEDFGLERSSLENLRVESPTQSLEIMRQVLDDQPGPARDIVAMNAGAGIYAAGLANTLREGTETALVAIASGAAARVLERLVSFTHQA
jgi:anthranilate phosphoribosyltransferase